MKRWGILVAAAVIVGLASPSVAQTESALQFFSGIVLAVDGAEKMLTVEEASEDAETITFSVPADATVRKDEQSISLGEISVGDAVSVEYETRGEMYVASAVEVLTEPTGS